MNHRLESDGRSVRAIFLSLALLIFITHLTGKVLSNLPHIHEYLIDKIAYTIGIVSAIYCLGRSYPLVGLTCHRTGVNFRHLALTVTPFLILLNFPFFTLFGYLDNLPIEYKLFLDYSFIERSCLLLLIFVAGPILEEVFFRGFIYRLVRHKYNIFWGVLISTGIFYMSHGMGTNNWRIVVISLIFTYIYEKTGNIWNSIMAHFMNNVLWFACLHFGIKYVKM